MSTGGWETWIVTCNFRRGICSSALKASSEFIYIKAHVEIIFLNSDGRQKITGNGKYFTAAKGNKCEVFIVF